MISEILNIEKSIDIITKTKFFSDDSPKYRLKSVYLEHQLIANIDFPIRLINACKSLNIFNLEKLLNTNYFEFLTLENCGRISIIKSQSKFIDYFQENYSSQIIDLELLNDSENLNSNNENKILSKQEIYPFFSNYRNILEKISIEIPQNKLLTKINEFNWGIRFSKFLNHHTEIENIKDLLNVHPKYILNFRNVGLMSIKESQEILIHFLSIGVTPEEKINSNLEDMILSKFNKFITNERNRNCFLEYFNFYCNSKYTLDEIGKRFKLTRERVRQIVENIERIIFRDKIILKDIFEEIEKRSCITEINVYLMKLVEQKQISGNKIVFFYNLITNNIKYNKFFLLDNDFILIKNNLSLLSKVFMEINNSIVIMISHLKEPVLISELLFKLKDIHEIENNNSDFYLNLECLKYLEKKYKKFHLVNDLVYNEMLYNILFGSRIKEIVYYCMVFINEPIHFKILTDFIKKRNKKLKHINNSSVSIALNSSDKYIMTDWGVYSLKRDGKLEYLSAVDAIINLLKEKSPLLEKQIVNLLREKYSDWNIKAALINNLNKKFIKIGNDLYDLKN